MYYIIEAKRIRNGKSLIGIARTPIIDFNGKNVVNGFAYECSRFSYTAQGEHKTAKEAREAILNLHSNVIRLEHDIELSGLAEDLDILSAYIF